MAFFLCLATAAKPSFGNSSCNSFGFGAANSTNSKPSTPMGFSNCCGCMPTLGCALMTCHLETGNRWQFSIIPPGEEPPQAPEIQLLNRADLGTDVDEFREERQVQGLLQELHPGGAAGAGLVADDALHGLHVPEAP